LVIELSNDVCFSKPTCLILGIHDLDASLNVVHNNVCNIQDIRTGIKWILSKGFYTQDDRNKQVACEMEQMILGFLFGWTWFSKSLGINLFSIWQQDFWVYRFLPPHPQPFRLGV
jgi:hypothetical protein